MKDQNQNKGGSMNQQKPYDQNQKGGQQRSGSTPTGHGTTGGSNTGTKTNERPWEKK